jgi:cysteine desulfurase
LEVFKFLEKKGCRVDYLPVEKSGCLDPKILRKALRPETILVSLAYANSEIGTVEPIIDIAKEIRHARKTSNWKGSDKFFRAPYFHLDASSVVLFLPLRTESVGADLITLDAQKIYGPKGAGALYIKTGTPLQSIFWGGKQEAGRRAGTENIPLIAGFAKAVEMLNKDRDSWALKLTKQRDYLLEQLTKKVHGLVLNGDLEKRLPNNINFSLPGTDSEFVLLQLAERGIICSAKSACLKDETGSYVVGAINNDLAVSQSTLRFTLDRNLNKADLDFIVKVLSKEIIRG